MTLDELSSKLQRVINVYAARFGIRRDEDWFLLKIQEELGELTAAHLKLTERGRRGTRTENELATNLEDEIADVLAMTILFARYKGVDLPAVFARKWFRHLPEAE